MASKECPLTVCVCVWEECLAAAVRGNAQLTTLHGPGCRGLLAKAYCVGVCDSIYTYAYKCMRPKCEWHANTNTVPLSQHSVLLSLYITCVYRMFVCECFVDILFLPLSHSPHHPNTHANTHKRNFVYLTVLR